MKAGNLREAIIVPRYRQESSEEIQGMVEVTRGLWDGRVWALHSRGSGPSRAVLCGMQVCREFRSQSSGEENALVYAPDENGVVCYSVWIAGRALLWFQRYLGRYLVGEKSRDSIN